MHDGGDVRAADEPVVAERGVLTAPGEGWSLAARRAEMIRELVGQRVFGSEAADAAAAEFGVSRRQVYVLVRRWWTEKASCRTCWLNLTSSLTWAWSGLLML